MFCDVCQHPIRLGQEDWVYQETREYAPGHTIVVYAAHTTCHTPPAENPQMNPDQMAYWSKLMGFKR